jgi:hypothetical protein
MKKLIKGITFLQKKYRIYTATSQIKLQSKRQDLTHHKLLKLKKIVSHQKQTAKE